MRRTLLPMMMMVLAAGLVACTAIPGRGIPAPPISPPPPTVPLQTPAPPPQPATHPSQPPVSEPKPPSVSPAAPAPGAVTGSKLTVTLTSSQGKKAQVYLFAADEQVRVMDASSCMAQAGDRLRSGHYQLYLVSEGAEPVRQNVTIFGDQPLQFNDMHPKYLTVLPGEQGRAPDVLLLQQYGSCNGTFAFALALSPDGRQLVSYNFISKRTSTTTGISSMEQLGPGILRTTVYNNATGIYTTTTWEVREASTALVATSVEEKGHS